MKKLFIALLAIGLFTALLSDSHLVSWISIGISVVGYIGAVYFERKEDKLNAVTTDDTEQ